MKTIVISTNGLGRYDDVSPFILADGCLGIKIVCPAFSGEFYLVAKNNGVQFKELLKGECELKLRGLTAGELVAEVKHYVKGQLVKSYRVEPLLIKELDGNLSATPEIASLRSDIDENAKVIAELKKEAQNSAELHNRLIANVAALIKFAYADYCDNPFLGGNTISDFIKMFGFDLTENEIKDILNKE